jgi:Mn-dependent DtxR family transcriptional regulator
MRRRFTVLQGQYLAFIYFHTKVHGRPPAETDMERHFQATPASVHQMVLTLQWFGFIEVTPGPDPSIRVLIRSDELPDLE